MKTIGLILSALALAGLTGCSSVPANTGQVATEEAVDKSQVAAIEGLARMRGVKIYWMHYPQKTPQP